MWVARIVGLTSCFAVPWMCAVVLLRLRKPRPAARRLARQPGFVACMAGTIGLAPGVCWIISTAHYRTPISRILTFYEQWFWATDFVAPVVVGAWLALGLGRRWRADPAWIDRAGRALGLYWVAYFVVLELYRLVWEVIKIL
jgi:hypothetical protein